MVLDQESPGDSPDGLDECGDLEALNKLTKLVLMLEKLPSKFAVLVSCRSGSQVDYAWRTASREVPREDLDKDEHSQTVRSIVNKGLEGDHYGHHYRTNTMPSLRLGVNGPI